jgi:hypothetical protein
VVVLLEVVAGKLSSSSGDGKDGTSDAADGTFLFDIV